MPTREVIIKSVLNRVPKDAINQFISRDKSSFSVLIMASLVGILAGIVGTYFEIAVRFVSETRTDWLKSEIAGVVPSLACGHPYQCGSGFCWLLPCSPLCP